MNLEQIRQDAFEDELQKIAATYDANARTNLYQRVADIRGQQATGAVRTTQPQGMVNRFLRKPDAVSYTGGHGMGQGVYQATDQLQGSSSNLQHFTKKQMDIEKSIAARKAAVESGGDIASRVARKELPATALGTHNVNFKAPVPKPTGAIEGAAAKAGGFLKGMPMAGKVALGAGALGVGAMGVGAMSRPRQGAY